MEALPAGMEKLIYFQLVAVLGIRNEQFTYGPRCGKTRLWAFANNKGADQPAHPGSLISVFVIHFLKSIISKLASSEISVF